MRIPVQVAARNTLISADHRDAITRAAERLATRHGAVVGCRVVVEAARTPIGLTVGSGLWLTVELAGEALVIHHRVTRDLGAAIQQAFEAAGRRLGDRKQAVRATLPRIAARDLLTAGAPEA